MVKLIDPMAQLRKWVGRIFHVHGKDATIMWDVIREYGIRGPKQWAFHRTPGFGDSNWTDIISELRRGGFKGCIDIEGWHDPVYRGDLEMTGQVAGLNYLKRCRAAFVPNPKV
jgi:sugar phosphate isomerase/epimerase